MFAFFTGEAANCIYPLLLLRRTINTDLLHCFLSLQRKKGVAWDRPLDLLAVDDIDSQRLLQLQIVWS